MTALAETVARLRAVDDELCRLELELEPGSGGDWVAFAALVDGALDDVFEAGNRTGDRRPDYLGASVPATLVEALLSAALPPLLVERRLPDVRPSNIAARLHAEHFWFDAITLRSTRCTVLDSDPADGDPDVETVADVAGLHHQLADVLVEAGTAWFPAVRKRAPFGRRGMWGQLADEVHGIALWTARSTGLDQRTVWAEAEAIVDAIAVRVPELRVRPRPFPVAWSGGEALWQVKGTCCLWYTTVPESEREDASYCTACPLIGDEGRHERLRDWTESQAAGEGS